MEYIALVESIDSIIEEEVTVTIDGITLTGFASICPYSIEEKKKYPISIGITIFDTFELVEQQYPIKRFSRVDNSFAYEIFGLLTENGVLDAGVLIEDDIFKEYSYMYGKYISIKVDRISLEFLKK